MPTCDCLFSVNDPLITRQEKADSQQSSSSPDHKTHTISKQKHIIQELLNFGTFCNSNQ